MLDISKKHQEEWISKSKKDLLTIIRSVVCDDKTAVYSHINWNDVWELAQKNHIEIIVYQAIPEEYRDNYRQVYFQLMARSIRQKHLLSEIERALIDGGISYAPLKGSILMNDYPEEIYRFMSDIDIYSNPSDRRKIRGIVESIGGQLNGTESGDEQFLFLTNLGVEFHGRLLYRKVKSVIENYPDWSFVNTNNNRLTEEGFALNLIGHAVYDLSKGGPGIRYILDLWVYRHRHHPQPNWNLVWDKLKYDKIDLAAQNLIDLSEYLFGTGEETALMCELAEYVLDAGLYGDAKRGIASEMARSGGKLKAINRQVCRNRNEYENRFQWLKKYPFLLPVAWIIRLFHSFKTNRKQIKTWLKGIRTIEKKEIAMQRDRLSRFGL